LGEQLFGAAFDNNFRERLWGTVLWSRFREQLWGAGAALNSSFEESRLSEKPGGEYIAISPSTR